MQDLGLKQSEQRDVVERGGEELQTIRRRLREYRETTQMQYDMGKYQKAMSNINQATNLTELTMLALKITEESKRAEGNATGESAI